MFDSKAAQVAVRPVINNQIPIKRMSQGTEGNNVDVQTTPTPAFDRTSAATLSKSLLSAFPCSKRDTSALYA